MSDNFVGFADAAKSAIRSVGFSARDGERASLDISALPRAGRWIKIANKLSVFPSAAMAALPREAFESRPEQSFDRSETERRAIRRCNRGLR